MTAPTVGADVAPPPSAVDAPPVRPVGYGLLAAASVTTWSGEAARRSGLFGLEYDPPPCRPAHRWPSNCEGPFPAGGRVFYDRDERVISAPFGVYYAESCMRVGTDDAETGQRARTGLSQGESRPVEAELWEIFDDAAGDLGAARGLVDTLGHLEEELGNRTGSLGIIHAPRRVAAHAAAAGLVRYDGPVPRTPGGNAWVFGTGYDASVGDPPPDGVRLVGTGPVFAWRDDVVVNGPFLDRRTNELTVIAERTYIVGFNCAAVSFTTPLSP